MGKITDSLKRIVVFNAKGGVGKTAIALNLALTHGYGIITNDPSSIVNDVLPPEKNIILARKILPEIPQDGPVIFDLAGNSDENAVRIIRASQFVLVPILPHKENLQTSLNFIAEIQCCQDNSRILLIINQTIGDQFEEIRKAFQNFYPDLAIFNLKKSSAFAWMTEHKISIAELCARYKLHARHFSVVAEQFNQITTYMRQKHGSE